MYTPPPTPALFGSKWEEIFWHAMVAAKKVFEYQVPFFGGHFARGGTVVDFMDETPGRLQAAAIYIDGPYWHQKRSQGKYLEDRMKRARLEKMGYKVLVLTTEAETPEGCSKWIRENL